LFLKRRALKRIYTAVVWALIGEAFGFVLVWSTDVTFIAPYVLIQIIAVACMVVGSLIGPKYRTVQARDLHDCFTDADLLFFDGVIDERQRLTTRDHCYQKFLRSIC
jgi:hypothetical protein